MQGRKLLINIMLKIELIERGIPELSLIVTVNDFQAVGILIVHSQSQALKRLKHFILSFQEENSRVMRIIINNNKNTTCLPRSKPERYRQCSHGVIVQVTQSSWC
jgi:hypothetical protein